MSRYGWRRRWLWPLATALLIALSGCSAPGASAAGPNFINTARAGGQTLQLGDLPAGYLLVVGLMPTDTQLAQQLVHPQDAATLAHDGRIGGTYRIFVYTTDEPTVVSAAMRIAVEMDYFGTSAGAGAWMSTRQSELSAAGPVVNVPTPGQSHVTRMTSYHAGDSYDTRAVLAFAQANVYVEIFTDFVGQGVSLDAVESYANLIDGRLLSMPTAVASLTLPV